MVMVMRDRMEMKMSRWRGRCRRVHVPSNHHLDIHLLLLKTS